MKRSRLGEEGAQRNKWTASLKHIILRRFCLRSGEKCQTPQNSIHDQQHETQKEQTHQSPEATSHKHYCNHVGTPNLTEKQISQYKCKLNIQTQQTLHHGDMTDATSLIRILQETKADEIYNSAAQSHVQVSFEEPEYTANSDALGVLRCLEAIRILGFEKIEVPNPKEKYRLLLLH